MLTRTVNLEARVVGALDFSSFQLIWLGDGGNVSEVFYEVYYRFDRAWLMHGRPVHEEGKIRGREQRRIGRILGKIPV